MKNVVISFIIFIIMLFTMIVSLKYLDNTCTSLEKSADSLEDIIKEEDWEKAYKSSMKIVDTWEKDTRLLAIIVHHQELDNIDAELWKLPQYVKQHTKDEALASVHVIKFFIEHINKLEKFNIQNLF